MQPDKSFNIKWLESFRLWFKSTVPQPYRNIVTFTIMIGVPILILYAVVTSTYTWWSILCIFIYFVIVALSMVNSYIGRKRAVSPTTKSKEGKQE